ncbi:hypothetical protein BH23CHL7_BH23CHL7_10560 [soil metagenome]
MAKMVRELGLLAVGVALFGVVIVWLLQGGNVLGNWLLAVFLVGHGWIHMMYVTPAPATATARAKAPQARAATAAGPEWGFPSLNHSWLLDRLGTPGVAEWSLVQVLVMIAVFGYSAAALATIPLLLPAALWQPLLLLSTVASAALMLLFFHRNLIIGLAIDAVLLVVLFGSLWAPRG